jgi:hypothetical protein
MEWGKPHTAILVYFGKGCHLRYCVSVMFSVLYVLNESVDML